MGKKGHRQKNMGKSDVELLEALADFTVKENWDKFFSIKGSDEAFEWYAEWPQVQKLLTDNLSFSSLSASDISILVPGCGNSKLSEHLYDIGFKNIINVDFSKVVIADMLRSNVHERPTMKWRVMDITSMQFANISFDAIIDKGGLDALMEPKHGPRSGTFYLYEVKRLLKSGGKFICLTLAESHVLDLLFSKFRFGWRMSLYTVAQDLSQRNVDLKTIMVVAEKDFSNIISDISFFADENSFPSHGNQVRELYKALEIENTIRSAYSSNSDIYYPVEDLNLGLKGNILEIQPGRRIKLTLGEFGVSDFCYNGILLDARQESGPFTYTYAIFIVPKMRANEWLYTSEEGQWVIVESSKVARLLMIVLDSINDNVAMEDIQKDLSPLVKQLTPGICDDDRPIPYLTAGGGIKQRMIVYQVNSKMTGLIVVDEVVYEEIYDDSDSSATAKELIFRRLTFERSENLVQSEALVSKEPTQLSNDIEDKKVQGSPPSKKNGKKKKVDSRIAKPLASSKKMKVDHDYLASSYHNGIISGVMLISHLQTIASPGDVADVVRTVVIGLGAGLLPMFIRNCMPSVETEVIELDPVVLDVATDYFDFKEDEHLKAYIYDGIQFVKERADSKAEGKGSSKIDILVVDVDSSDPSSGLTCPAKEFIEESFLWEVQVALSERGLFVLNLVSRSSSLKESLYSRLKKVFKNLYSLQLEEDVNEVIFALKTDSIINEEQFSEALFAFEKSMELEKKTWSERVLEASRSIKRLK